MQPPPSRYRVVERGGRLVVLDSAVGGAPLAARDLLPGIASDEGSDALSLDQYPRESGDPGPQVLPPAILDPRLRGDTKERIVTPRPAQAQAMIAEPPGAARSVAATVAGDVRDDQGRLLLITARWYDAKAPRTLALSEAGERQLGGVVLALTVGAIIAIVLGVMGETFGWVIVVVGFVLISRAKPVATAWLDRLDDA